MSRPHTSEPYGHNTPFRYAKYMMGSHRAHRDALFVQHRMRDYGRLERALTKKYKSFGKQYPYDNTDVMRAFNRIRATYGEERDTTPHPTSLPSLYNTTDVGIKHIQLRLTPHKVDEAIMTIMNHGRLPQGSQYRNLT